MDLRDCLHGIPLIDEDSSEMRQTGKERRGGGGEREKRKMREIERERDRVRYEVRQVCISTHNSGLRRYVGGSGDDGGRLRVPSRNLIPPP